MLLFGLALISWKLYCGLSWGLLFLFNINQLIP